MAEPSGILIASHPRSGTHLLIDVIRRNFPATRSWRWWGQPLDYLYFNIERSTSENRNFDEAFRKKILNRPSLPLMKTHYLADYSSTWVEEETGPVPKDVREVLDRSTVLYIHRDPREVMVSYKQFLAAIRPDVAGMSLINFMTAPHWTGNSHIEWWKSHVLGWMAVPDSHSLSYNDLIRDPRETVENIGKFIGRAPQFKTPVLPAKVKSVTKTRMDRLLSLSPDSTGIVADRQRFPSTPWQQEMTESDHFWLEEQIGDLMDQLGYARAAKETV